MSSSLTKMFITVRVVSTGSGGSFEDQDVFLVSM